MSVIVNVANSLSNETTPHRPIFEKIWLIVGKKSPSSKYWQVAFSQRRKLLRHTLGVWLSAQGYTGDFDLRRRAEEVPVEAYIDLLQALPPVRP